ncbi:LysR family transcriptional regulator [Roseiarcus fermentans]|uniref:LysR family transcriptional regulator n=1 Tax=Roseiarcus fermentans TaxID=1473586 RepID=A0A366FBC1_9HYPH|nr:LysR family transcriptional regulator [Roseiarcus fermentans]RBP11931.1 LysR family transcriptional regulator [Roseiarcus fermentans]
MREVNLAALDLNLLPALEALLRRRNVTHAAAEVGLSQPAMSRALARLRDVFDDPLLVRAGGGLAPTPAALALAPKVAAALEGLRGLFRVPVVDPARLERTIRLAAADAQTILIVPRVASRLEREAPGVDLVVSTIGRDIMARMEQGEVDLCFATAATPLPPGAASETLADDRLALVMRRGHPGADRDWALADYARYRHATVSFFGDGVSEIDARLGAAGVERRVALTTPHFMATVAAVAGSDLVTTISAAFARRFASPLGLVLKPPPFDDALVLTVVSTRAGAADPALRWFRTLLREEAAVAYRAPQSRSIVSSRR